MKRIISIILALSTLLCTVTALSSCKKEDDDVPEGLQLVKGGEDVGYYFYGPEGWTVANQGNISSTYVSSVNYTSLTFVPLGAPEIKDENFSYALYVKKLFEDDLEKYNQTFEGFSLIESPTVREEDGQIPSSTFGNADEAYKFIYSYTYEDRSYTAMQIFSIYSGNVYLFTYNASNAEFMNEKSFYTFYLNDYIQPAINNFKFVSKTSDEDQKKYPTDSDGYNLVSDKTASGFDMYLPTSYSVDIASGIISASKANGVGVTMSAMINTTVYPHGNYLDRIEKLEKLSDDGKVEKIVENATFYPDNAAIASEYEYKYTLFGTTYHVYQVYIVDSNISRNFYVFTFTAPESVYAEELGEAKTIFSKIGF